MEELKPCPFCGGEASTSHGSNITGGKYFFVSCEACNCRTSDFYEWYFGGAYEREAIEAWNRRVSE